MKFLNKIKKKLTDRRKRKLKKSISAPIGRRSRNTKRQNAEHKKLERAAEPILAAMAAIKRRERMGITKTKTLKGRRISKA